MPPRRWPVGTSIPLASSGAGYDDQNNDDYRNVDGAEEGTTEPACRRKPHATNFEFSLEALLMQEGVEINSANGDIRGWGLGGRGMILRNEANRARRGKIPNEPVFGRKRLGKMELEDAKRTRSRGGDEADQDGETKPTRGIQRTHDGRLRRRTSFYETNPIGGAARQPRGIDGTKPIL